MHISRMLLAVASLIVLAAAFGSRASVDGQAPWRHWQTGLNVGHPLVGKIWAARENGFVTPRALADDLSDSHFVLIGEVHDNADHHRLQAWLIGEIGRRRKPTLVVEMIRRDQSAGLDAYLAKPDASAADVGPALDWETSGWPDWPLYQPIAEAALRAGLRLAGGSPSRARTRAIGEGGLETLELEDRRRLALDRGLPADLQEALHRDIIQSHCNALPEEAAGPMAEVQRYRDAIMASALVGGDHDGAILIAGNGHVRSDRGVPWYLAGLAPQATASSVMLIEIPDIAATLSNLLVADPAGKPAADYFWFTPEARREDQCELLRRRIER